jgi:hypothetical protein
VEREIGNVAADAGLKAFRYLSFAPVVFEARPEAPPADSEPGASEPGASESAALQPGMPTLPAVADRDRVATVAALAEEPVENPAIPAPSSEQPAASRPAFPANLPPGLFSATPGMPSFTTVTEAANTPTFVVAGPALSVVPETSLSEPAPALTAQAPPEALAKLPPAPALAGTPDLRRIAELQGGGAPRTASVAGSGTARRYALLQDIRAELAGGPERRPVAPLPKRKPPA